MQTFLPYASFYDSARVLDNRRLGKQRVETLQILNALTGPTKGWRNHPATKMWANYKTALVSYGAYICGEWRARGFRDTCRDKILQFANDDDFYSMVLPPWLGDPDFHRSHQSNLVRKMPDHYRQFFPDIPDDLPYIWPTP
jgi:hypothetical protein